MAIVFLPRNHQLIQPNLVKSMLQEVLVLSLQFQTQMIGSVKDQYLLIGKACSNSNDADQMVDGVVEADSLFKEAT